MRRVSHSPLAVPFVVGLVQWIAWTCTSYAQWTAISLHPEGVNSSSLSGIKGGQPSGVILSHPQFGSPRAAIWSGLTSAYVELAPQASFSSVRAAATGTQAGYAYIGGDVRASVWHGTAGSRVDLHPEMAFSSQVYGTDGAQQVGFASIPTTDKAALWTGSAESFVNLNPANASASFAMGVQNGEQGGAAFIAGRWEAGMWSGTAASWRSLHPVGWQSSQISDMHNGEQVGRVGGGLYRASLWRGTAGSWVNLEPPEARDSEANAVYDGQQVGWIIGTSGSLRASLWHGTAASWIDLHAVLPAGYSSSTAEDIWHDDEHTYVAGEAHNESLNRREAYVWIGPVPCPSAVSVLGIGLVAVLRYRR
ncbi:hypothetical protein PHYC_02940 [Phycisphaerales bacterium]|nr:hypothetical protein PHYC_02940 [Phycisphaerales bacterium]